MNQQEKELIQRAALDSCRTTGKVYVFSDEEFETKKIFDYDYPKDLPPAICFPAEPGQIWKAWRANLNALGMPVANCKYNWSLIAVHDNRNAVKFYLRDNDGYSQGINWGFIHHAIFYSNWKEYEFELNGFVSEITDFKIELLNNIDKAKRLKSLQRFPPSYFDFAIERLNYWLKNLCEWIEKEKPHITRLQKAESRLTEATLEIKTIMKNIETKKENQK